MIDASVLDNDSTVVVNGNNTGRDVGTMRPRRRGLHEAAESDAYQQLLVIYTPEGAVLENREPIELADRTYGMVSVTMSGGRTSSPV